MPFLEDHRWLRKAAFVALGFGMILGSVGLERLADLFATAWIKSSFHLFAYGIEHLGVVLIVAILAKAIFEEADQRALVGKSVAPVEQLIKKLTEGMSSRLENLIDKPLQEALEESVLNPTFMRYEYALGLKLEPLLDGAGKKTDFLQVFVDIRYKVRNVSNKAATYGVAFWLDDVIKSQIASGSCRFLRVESFGDKKSLLYTHDLGKLEQDKKIVRDSGVMTLEVETGLIDPNSVLYVGIESVHVMRTEDHFVWNLASLTQTLDVAVELKNGLTFQDLKVFPRVMHHCGQEAFTPVYQQNLMTMSINQVLLPFQGIELRWHPGP